ncbi:heat shock factor 2-binding protein isoform X2 [Arapaima gigas]
MHKTVGKQDCGAVVKVRKRDLERLTTEVMQLRDFLPAVINREVLEKVHQGRMVDSVKECAKLEQEQLRQDCAHLRSRLDAALCECQREREEKLALRQQLWVSQEQLQQQAEFCTMLGAASCTLLWSVSSKEEAVKDILADSKIEAFLAIAAQTLESFVHQSLDREEKLEQQLGSQELQFVLALAGVVTNIGAVACGRDFLSHSARILLDTLMQLIRAMKPGVCSKLKVLMLMALYNVSISIKGLKYISESPCLLQLLPTLLQDSDGEVCHHALRLLHSLLLQEDVTLTRTGPALWDSLPLTCLQQLRFSRYPGLCQAAQEMLDGLAMLGAPWRDVLSREDEKGTIEGSAPEP